MSRAGPDRSASWEKLQSGTFPLPDGQQAVLVAVAEGALGHGLEVSGVDASAGDGVAALAHAGVVAQPALVQVRVGQSVAAGDTLGLETGGGSARYGATAGTKALGLKN